MGWYSSVRSGVARFVEFGRGLGVVTRWPCLVPTRVRLRGTCGSGHAALKPTAPWGALAAGMPSCYDYNVHMLCA